MPRAHPECHVQLWCQDEARFGQQGTLSRVWADPGSRPGRLRQTEYRYVYLFGAVCPATRDQRLAQAGWHTTPALRVPNNLTLLPRPALHQRHLSNRVYADQAALDDAVATAWNTLVDDPTPLRRLCDFAWIQAAREAV